MKKSSVKSLVYFGIGTVSGLYLDRAVCRHSVRKRLRRKTYMPNDWRRSVLKDLDTIIFESRKSAEEAEDHLTDMILKNGYVTVIDLCDYAGVRCEYSNRHYGWRKNPVRSISRARNGYILNLIQPTKIYGV